MEKRNARKYKWQFICLGVLVLLALLVVILPHIWMGLYNYPSGDDYSFSLNNHRALNQGGMASFIKSALIDNPVDWANKWEARWAIPMLVGLSPSVFGIGAYRLCTPIAFALIIISFLFFTYACFGKAGNRIAIFIITAIFLIMAILYVPYPTATFYWWTGIGAYTAPFALSLIVLGTVFRLLNEELKATYWIRLCIIGPIAFVLGGTSYTISIMTFSSLVALCGARLLYDLKSKNDTKILRKNIFTQAYVIIMQSAGLLLVFLSPAMKIQLSSRYGGDVENGIFSAIFNSIKATIGYLASFVCLRNILLVILVIPLAVLICRNIKYKFYCPLGVSFVSVLILASGVSVNMLVDGSTGGDYATDVWFYASYMAILANIIYWVGWAMNKEALAKPVEKLLVSKEELKIFIWVVAFSACLAGVIYIKDLKVLSSYQAYNYVNNGWSQQYAAQWDERMAVLNDPDIKEVYFEPIRVYGGYIQMYDLYPKGDVAYWINQDIANYYGKTSVDLVETE